MTGFQGLVTDILAPLQPWFRRHHRRKAIVNAALLLVATSVCGWGDAVPATAVVAPPVAGCSGCATPCSDCKPGFFDRLKANFAHHEDCGCAPAPCHVKPSCGC